MSRSSASQKINLLYLMSDSTHPPTFLFIMLSLCFCLKSAGVAVVAIYPVITIYKFHNFRWRQSGQVAQNFMNMVMKRENLKLIKLGVQEPLF
jgi:hypothetical protein